MQPLKALIPYFKKYKWMLIAGILCVIISNLFRVVAPELTGYLVDTLVNIAGSSSQNSSASTHPHEVKNYGTLVQQFISWFNTVPEGSRAVYAALILFALALLSGFFMFLMRQTLIVMSRYIEFDQKNDIFKHYQILDKSFYKNHTVGDLMNRISEDVSKVRMFTGPALMYFVNLLVIIAMSLYFMFSTSVLLTIFAILPLPFLTILIFYVNKIINKKAEATQSLLSTLTSASQESYSGIRIIKSFTKEKSFTNYFSTQVASYRNNMLSLAKTEAIYFPGIALLVGLSTVLSVFIGTYPLDGVDVSLGTITSFVLYIQMLTFPVSAIGWTAGLVQKASVSQRRINEFLDNTSEITDVINPTSIDHIENINFSNVSFTYPETGIEALKKINFSIKPAQKIAIMGNTGSGKSTLVNMLMRMYDVDSGSIFINELAIKEIKLADVRNNMGVVTQDVLLFSESIADNIKLGMPHATQKAVEEAAADACVLQEVQNFTNGFDTVIGERGITLSGGQKQRISLARALIKKPDVLILDDCLSAIDTQTASQIAQNFNEKYQHTTILIITHRFIPEINFDQIIFLADGTVAEQGTHEQLLKLQGLYYDYYQHQNNA